MVGDPLETAALDRPTRPRSLQRASTTTAQLFAGPRRVCLPDPAPPRRLVTTSLVGPSRPRTRGPRSAPDRLTGNYFESPVSDDSLCLRVRGPLPHLYRRRETKGWWSSPLEWYESSEKERTSSPEEGRGWWDHRGSEFRLPFRTQEVFVSDVGYGLSPPVAPGRDPMDRTVFQ